MHRYKKRVLIVELRDEHSESPVKRVLEHSGELLAF